MSLPLLAFVVLAVLGLGYRLYGGFVSRQYQLNPATPTPSRRLSDGVDFVPTRPFYLLGQHFSAIAAAGPIAGPIMACQQFGWLPAILWIGLGVVFIGAVHDLSILVASVRHEGKSIAEVVKTHLGANAGLAMLGFIYVALIYVIVAFADVTASTFVSGDADLEGMKFAFNPGGAVALSSVLYLALAVAMGFVERFLKPPLWLSTAIFVPATLFVVWLGTQFSTLLILTGKEWSLLILAYCFVASLTPVWALLQPRGYLGGFILYLALAVGTIGIFFGHFPIVQPAFKGFVVPGTTGSLFPFLFVTIACGACSGFHGLVCSGTTSKQIAHEQDCKPVGYGAMLLEGFVALIALGTVMIVSSSDAAIKGPGALYGEGLGRFLTVIIGTKYLPFAMTFGAMAFSTFVFDTLDVCTRLGRFILKELCGFTFKGADVFCTAVTVLLPLGFVMVAPPGAWRTFWTLFGTSNQLLAALSLLAVSVWLKQEGRKYWYTLVPAVFVSIITFWALVIQIRIGLLSTASHLEQVNAGVGAVLLVLASVLVAISVMALRKPAPQTATAMPAEIKRSNAA